MTTKTPRRKSGSAPLHGSRAALIFPIVWGVIILVPLLLALATSLRTQHQWIVQPIGFPTTPQWSNFVEAWNQGQLGQAFLNSSEITVVSVVGVVVLGSIAAYPLARFRGRVFGSIYIYFIAGLIVPVQLGLPTLYQLWNQLGLVDQPLGVALIQIGFNLPFAIFLFVGFIRSLPAELEEAAWVDGAGPVRTFVSVIFPLLAPATATVVILTAIGVWNDLIVSVFFLQTPETQTLPRAIFSFMGTYSSSWTLILACVVLAIIPLIVLYLALQRFFLRGLTAGALRS